MANPIIRSARSLIVVFTFHPTSVSKRAALHLRLGFWSCPCNLAKGLVPLAGRNVHSLLSSTNRVSQNRPVPHQTRGATNFANSCFPAFMMGRLDFPGNGCKRSEMPSFRLWHPIAGSNLGLARKSRRKNLISRQNSAFEESRRACIIER